VEQSRLASNLFQDTLGKYAVTVISAECERIFSNAGKIVTPERNRLGDDIIEAGECLKAWWDSDLFM
jgi:hAT family C-terminal dimerisation region